MLSDRRYLSNNVFFSPFSCYLGIWNEDETAFLHKGLSPTGDSPFFLRMSLLFSLKTVIRSRHGTRQEKGGNARYGSAAWD